MRIDPVGVYLRLEPGATFISHTTGNTRTRPAVELHWKGDRKWLHRTFAGSEDTDTLSDILIQVARWLEAHPDINVALASLEGKP